MWIIIVTVLNNVDNTFVHLDNVNNDFFQMEYVDNDFNSFCITWIMLFSQMDKVDNDFNSFDYHSDKMDG